MKVICQGAGLKKYKDPITAVMSHLALTFNFTPPYSIKLKRFKKSDLGKNWATTWHHPSIGYVMYLDTVICDKMADSGFMILRHECCHIAEMVLTGDMCHTVALPDSEIWRQLYASTASLKSDLSLNTLPELGK